MPAHPMTITDAAIDLFTGYGTESAAAVMMSGTLELRLILVRTLIAAVTSSRPEVDDPAGLSEAYHSLTELQRSFPNTVEELLFYPHTGVWLNHVLHRLNTVDSDAAQAVPLWADCGYLGWLAAAGSIMNSPHGSVRLVLRDGAVMLPGIGFAQLGAAGEFSHCVLHWEDGELRFITDGGGSMRISSQADETVRAWHPMPRLHRAAGQRDILFDESDPFRELRIDPPPRLTAAEVDTWRENFTAAWGLLEREYPRYVAPMRECLRVITPLTARPVAASISHTSFNGMGCVYTTAPADPCVLAMSLIHEIQHTKLAMITDQVQLFEPDETCRFYAPWRDDPRPILGLLHGIYAFFGVADFWRIHRHSECHGSLQAHTMFERWRRQLADAIEQAWSSGLLTELGRHFLTVLSAGLELWASEQVPVSARQATSEIMAAHRTFWQVRNLTVRDGDLTELADQWATKVAAPSVLPSRQYADQSAIPDHHRQLHLSAQIALNEPAAAHNIAVPDQPRGDGAYLAGEWSEAVELYVQELAADPLRPQLWAGLTLALPKSFPGSTFGVLDNRAEVAAALHARLLANYGSSDVVAVVRWLSGQAETGPHGPTSAGGR